jgi:hypothetical protein
MLKLWICSTAVFAAQMLFGVSVLAAGGGIETALSVTMIATVAAGVAALPVSMLVDKILNNTLSTQMLRIGKIIAVEILAAGLTPVFIGVAFAALGATCAKDEWEERNASFLPMFLTALPFGIGTLIGGAILLFRHVGTKSTTAMC